MSGIGVARARDVDVLSTQQSRLPADAQHITEHSEGVRADQHGARIEQPRFRKRPYDPRGCMVGDIGTARPQLRRQPLHALQVGRDRFSLPLEPPDNPLERGCPPPKIELSRPPAGLRCLPVQVLVALDGLLGEQSRQSADGALGANTDQVLEKTWA